MAEFDVIVVGAGPTGLLAAAELALAGIRPAVLDALTERNPLSRAGVILPRTAELLDQRGLLEPLLATGDFPEISTGHFAGLPVDFRAWPTRQPAYNVPQTKIETFLEAHLADLGVPVQRGHRVADLTAGVDRVAVTADAPDGAVEFHGRFLVAADGARSTIRKILDMAFPGRPGTSTMVTAEAVLAGPASTSRGHAQSGSGHWIIQFPLEDSVRRLVLGGPGRAVPKEAEVTEHELRAGLRAVYGDEAELVEVRRAARIDDAARQITAYRVGGVFFAGDAAHIHLPFGGQGMNTGIGDAVNLGWKLAAAVHGWAPDELLDTYSAERHPIAARVLANTQTQGLLLDWAGTGNPDLAAARGVLADMLRVPEAARWLAGMMSGLDIRYDIAGAADHPLVGHRIPDLGVTVAGERRRIHTLLRAGRGLLLDLTHTGRLASSTNARADRLDHVHAALHEEAPATAMLVRPDGHVCWADEPRLLHHALRSWFGDPTTPHPVRRSPGHVTTESLLERPATGWS